MHWQENSNFVLLRKPISDYWTPFPTGEHFGACQATTKRTERVLSMHHSLKVGFCVLALAFLLAMKVSASAQEGMCVFPTAPGEVTYPEGWGAPVLRIHAAAATISPDQALDLWVESSGYGCPLYIWSVEGMGYSLTDATTSADGSSNKTTLNVVG